MIHFHYPACGADLWYPTSGEIAACGHCGQDTVVPYPAEEYPKVRCFECGRFVPANRCRRMERPVGRTTGGWSGSIHGQVGQPGVAGQYVFGSQGTAHFAVVDVCYSCVDAMEEQAREERRLLLNLFACGFLAVSIGGAAAALILWWLFGTQQ